MLLVDHATIEVGVVGETLPDLCFRVRELEQFIMQEQVARAFRRFPCGGKCSCADFNVRKGVFDYGGPHGDDIEGRKDQGETGLNDAAAQAGRNGFS